LKRAALSAAHPGITRSLCAAVLEKADILSVLLFGKPAHELGQGESVALQRQALGLAAGYVMPEVRTSVMNTSAIDLLWSWRY
jgi:hypothetical protein